MPLKLSNREAQFRKMGSHDGRSVSLAEFINSYLE